MTSQSEDSNIGRGGDASSSGGAEPQQAGQAGEAGMHPGESGADPSSDSPPSLETQLAEARREASENYDRFVRAKAELDNVLKRQQRELADRSRYEGEALCRDLLPVLDGLEGALSHAGSDDAAALAGGVELVLKSMLAALRRAGVEKIEAEGKPFDPADHEAVSTFETTEVPNNSVYAVHRCGYRMRERLLRAAMVTVAKAPAAATSSDA